MWWTGGQRWAEGVLEGEKGGERETGQVTKMMLVQTMTEAVGHPRKEQAVKDKVSTDVVKETKGDKKESAEVIHKKLPYMGITKPLGTHLMASTK